VDVHAPLSDQSGPARWATGRTRADGADGFPRQAPKAGILNPTEIQVTSPVPALYTALPMPLPAGTKLGSYEVTSLLGEGGMGAVYRARDSRLNRDVAIKVISLTLAADDTAMARFEREAMAVASLSHPNILSIFEFSRAGDTPFVVMELVAGETLRARLDRGPIPARKGDRLRAADCQGLGAAHARGLVHRDLKPENVMVSADDHVKIWISVWPRARRRITTPRRWARRS
jgi:serine/threonine protein kinase